MKTKSTLLLLLLTFACSWAQKPIFDNEILVENFAGETFMMPPSPLVTQVVFVGGYDIVQTTPTYGAPAGRAIAKEWNDFIGFTPDDSGESLGWVGVNHEMIYRDDQIGDGGGMTAFRVRKDANGYLEVMDQELEDGRRGKFFNVDFVNTVGETGMNCGGIVGPNGRIWTAEEWYRGDNSSIWNSSARTSSLPLVNASVYGGYGVRDTADFTIQAPEFPAIDGMSIKKNDNFNYMTEVDLKSAKAVRKQYNWGRAGWEGGAISNDGKYVYLGIDATPAPWVRFTAETPFDFTKGKVEVYKEDNAQGERWIEIDMDIDNIFGGLSETALSVGATMFVRNEWVTIDRNTGIVYWSETGRDSGSSGPGIIFSYVRDSGYPALPASWHNDIAVRHGAIDAFDTAYQDYYGRVNAYNPATEEIYTVVHGGPYLSEPTSMEDYPDKHLSNPDGLSILTMGDETFLLIQEDLNGRSFGRVPDGVSNKLCELYVLTTSAKDADVSDLVRITAIPKGAEITGAIQIDDNTILVNSQHPDHNNPFPYNHSLTLAIHGFRNVATSTLDTPDDIGEHFIIYPNPTTRELNLESVQDFAIYDNAGKRIKVFRNKKQADVSDLSAGVYYIKLNDGATHKFIVQ